jgi:hypothetical protein
MLRETYGLKVKEASQDGRNYKMRKFILTLGLCILTDNALNSTYTIFTIQIDERSP